MACFIVPGVEAAVVTILAKKAAKKEAQQESTGRISEERIKVPFRRKLKWLRNMLWGGVVLLAFEHIWHGEVVPWFPFLTAASNPEDAMAMLGEMATVGVCMALLITIVWFAMCKIADYKLAKSDASAVENNL